MKFSLEKAIKKPVRTTAKTFNGYGYSDENPICIKVIQGNRRVAAQILGP